MSSEFDKLESRFDKLEAWHEAQLAVEKEKAKESSLRNRQIQLGLSIVNTLSVFVNFYLTAKH